MGDEIPGEDCGGLTSGEGPEEEDGEEEWDGDRGRKGVSSLMMWE